MGCHAGCPARARDRALGARRSPCRRRAQLARAGPAGQRRGRDRQDEPGAAVPGRPRPAGADPLGGLRPRSSPRARWGRCWPWPRGPAASSGRWSSAGRCRTRWWRRSPTSWAPGPRPCSSSRTCTGRTRPPSTSCGCSPAGWRRCRPWSWPATATTRWTAPTRSGSCSASWPGARRWGGCSWCGCRRRRSRSSPSRTASTRASSTARPPATRSSWSRRSPPARPRSRTRSGTRCWPGRPG